MNKIRNNFKRAPKWMRNIVAQEANGAGFTPKADDFILMFANYTADEFLELDAATIAEVASNYYMEG